MRTRQHIQDPNRSNNSPKRSVIRHRTRRWINIDNTSANMFIKIIKYSKLFF
jgi:hypothetical protein